MPVPNTFANATTSIPLSQLDANFATAITLGNTAIQLGNTVSTLNNMTLANVTISSGTVTVANVTVTGVGTFAAGSNTAPSITTAGDTNTGIYFPAADTIAFTEGGVESMRIDSSGNFLFNSGYGSVATAYGCRVWVNFDGTGTVAIRASGNVTSITDNGTGQYTMNFTTALPDANYCAAAASFVAGTAIIVRTISFATTSLSLNTTNSAASDVDASTVSIAIFR